MPGLPIGAELSPEELRWLARREEDRRVVRRLLALANALDGMSRATAARAAGMDRQTLRDWVIRYNRGGVAALSDAWGDGCSSLLFWLPFFGGGRTGSTGRVLAKRVLALGARNWPAPMDRHRRR